MSSVKLMVMTCVSAMALGAAFFLGKDSANTDGVEITKDGQFGNLEEIAKISNDFDMAQQRLNNQVAEVQNQIETTKLNLNIQGEDAEVNSLEINNRIEAINDRVARMKEEDISDSVPIPPDSPSGKLLAQPRAASGIPVSVLENYERETGVSSSEIEELMSRTK